MKAKRIWMLGLLTLVMLFAAFFAACSGTPAGFAISVEQSPNGTVTADAEYAEEGETIVLMAVADEGFELKEITVNGTAIDGLSFMMPGENVLVRGRFEKIGNSAAEDETDLSGDPALLTEAVPETAISYDIVIGNKVSGEARWTLVYEESSLRATAYIPVKPVSGKDGIRINVSREDIPAAGMAFLLENTISVEMTYLLSEKSAESTLTVRRANEKGILEDTVSDGIISSIVHWRESETSDIGYKAVVEIPYSFLGYSDKSEARGKVTVMFGNMNAFAGESIAFNGVEGEKTDGEWTIENSLTYPRLTDDNRLENNYFLPYVGNEYALQAHRDVGRSIDGVLEEENFGGRDALVRELSNAEVNGGVSVVTQISAYKAKDGAVFGAKIWHTSSIDTKLQNNGNETDWLNIEMDFGNGTQIIANAKGGAIACFAAAQTQELEQSGMRPYLTTIEFYIPYSVIGSDGDTGEIKIPLIATYNEAGWIAFVKEEWDTEVFYLTDGGLVSESKAEVGKELKNDEGADFDSVDGIIESGEYGAQSMERVYENSSFVFYGKKNSTGSIKFAVETQHDWNAYMDVPYNDGLHWDKTRYMNVELGFGEGTVQVLANIFGDCINCYAKSVVTENPAGSAYRYTTVIEIYVPVEIAGTIGLGESSESILYKLSTVNEDGQQFQTANWAEGFQWYNIGRNGFVESDSERNMMLALQNEEAYGRIDGIFGNGEYDSENWITGKSGLGMDVSVNGYVTSEGNVVLAVKLTGNAAAGLFAFSLGENYTPLIAAKAATGLEPGCDKAYFKAKAADETTGYAAMEFLVPSFAIASGFGTITNFVNIPHIYYQAPDNNAYFFVNWQDTNSDYFGLALTDKGFRYLSEEIKAADAAEFAKTDGKIEEGEYGGEWLSASYASSEGESYDVPEVLINGRITERGNLRFAIKVRSNFHYVLSFAFGGHTSDQRTIRNTTQAAGGYFYNAAICASGEAEGYRIIEYFVPGFLLEEGTIGGRVSVAYGEIASYPEALNVLDGYGEIWIGHDGISFIVNS